jgi:competence ComEA-like helix-hairpin-helix protein
MSSDRRAVVLLLLTGLAGAVVRLAGHSDAAPGAVAYQPSRQANPAAPLDSVAARAARLARPLKRGDRIDLDVASAEEIARLPRIGPGLAARIVAERDEHGPFGSLEALDRVSGVGPALLTAIKPFAAFSRPSERPSVSPSVPVSLNTASVEELDQLPGIGPAKAKAIVEDRSQRGPYQSLDDLSRVPGLHGSVIKRLKGRVVVP